MKRTCNEGEDQHEAYSKRLMTTINVPAHHSINLEKINNLTDETLLIFMAQY